MFCFLLFDASARAIFRSCLPYESYNILSCTCTTIKEFPNRVFVSIECKIVLTESRILEKCVFDRERERERENRVRCEFSSFRSSSSSSSKGEHVHEYVYVFRFDGEIDGGIFRHSRSLKGSIYTRIEYLTSIRTLL